jgi:hypothetical protein
LQIPLKEGIGVKGCSKTKVRQLNFTNNSIVVLRQKLSTYSQLSGCYEYDYEILGLPSVKMYHTFTNLFGIKNSKGEEI